MIKLNACCTQCDEPVFEPVSIHPNDHPKAGRVVRAGKLIDDDAVRVTFILTSGRQSQMTLCGKCADAYDMTAMWRKNLAALAEEVDDPYRKVHPKARDTLAELAQEVPLGEIYRQRWKDMADARLR